MTKNITAQSAKAVEELRDEQMVTTRKPKPQPTTENLITSYWEEEDYVPPTVKQGLKASTVYLYLQIWEQFLKEHFTGPIRAAIHANPDLLRNIRALVMVCAVHAASCTVRIPFKTYQI